MRATQKCPTYKSRLSLERDLSRIPVLFFVPDNHTSSDAAPLAANPKNVQSSAMALAFFSSSAAAAAVFALEALRALVSQALL
jgi:hypothetical protein